MACCNHTESLRYTPVKLGLGRGGVGRGQQQQSQQQQPPERISSSSVRREPASQIVVQLCNSSSNLHVQCALLDRKLHHSLGLLVGRCEHCEPAVALELPRYSVFRRQTPTCLLHTRKKFN